MNKTAIAAIVGSVLLAIILVSAYFVSAINSETALRTALEAKQKDISIVYDNTWKIIREKGNVSSEYEGKFKEIYTSMMDARYSNKENLLANFIREANPNLSIDLRKDLMRSIEIERNSFTNKQREGLELQMQHNILLRTYPKAIIYNVLGRQPFDLKIITSDRTQKAIDSGKDDVIIGK